MPASNAAHRSLIPAKRAIAVTLLSPDWSRHIFAPVLHGAWSLSPLNPTSTPKEEQRL